MTKDCSNKKKNLKTKAEKIKKLRGCAQVKTTTDKILQITRKYS